jgi:urocanate hydratase
MASEWISIATADGAHLGKYQITDGLLIVCFGSQEKRTRASTALLGDPNSGIARLMLSEMVREMETVPPVRRPSPRPIVLC